MSPILLAVGSDTVMLEPIENRPLVPISLGVDGEGGTRKSPALTAVATGVVMAMWPDAVAVGTTVFTTVALPPLTSVRVILKKGLLLAYAVSKLVPVTVTAVPMLPAVGLN